jgi:prolyl 4-hydroxylase
VSLAVRFSPDLVTWILAGLQAGQSPEDLVRVMITESMELRVACWIIDAVVTAKAEGRAVPTSSIVIEENAPLPYVAGAPRLSASSRIEADDRAVQVLARATRPTLAVMADVLAPEECEELIELARPRLRPSTVVDPASGQDVVATYRDSLGMFFRPAENALVARLDRRVARLMNLPVERGEGFQVLRYGEGAHSAPHFDYLQPTNASNAASIERSGQRVSTLVIYLNDVEAGGETSFPCTGWSVSAIRGHACYFEYANGLGQVDPRSLHAGAPVRRGEKWVLTKWMRERPFVSAGAGD